MNPATPRLFQKAIGALFIFLACEGLAELPNIVKVEGYQGAYEKEAEQGEPRTSALGFIVERDGFLMTTYKNLTDPASGRLLDSFRVGMGDDSGKTYEARVIGVEPTINLGILKIESDESFEPSHIARDRVVTVGDRVAAVGKLAGGEKPLVEGTVEGLNSRECYQESLTSTMFRAKIELSDDSLGGPVFFADSGEVAALYTGFKPVAEQDHVEVIGETHLLPISLCFNIYESIKQKGSLKSPWTGFSVRPLNEAEMKFFPTEKGHHGGIAIEHVWDNSPAQKLGIKPNDILVQFSYNRILTVGEFQKWLYLYGVGHPVKLMLLRDGREYLIADYLIEERPEWAKPE